LLTACEISGAFVISEDGVAVGLGRGVSSAKTLLLPRSNSVDKNANICFFTVFIFL